MSGTTKVKRTYSLEPRTVALIEQLAQETRRDKSAIVDLAVEGLAESMMREKLAGIINQGFRRRSDDDDLPNEDELVVVTPEEALHRMRQSNSDDLAQAETVDLVAKAVAA